MCRLVDISDKSIEYQDNSYILMIWNPPLWAGQTCVGFDNELFDDTLFDQTFPYSGRMKTADNAKGSDEIDSF